MLGTGGMVVTFGQQVNGGREELVLAWVGQNGLHGVRCRLTQMKWGHWKAECPVKSSAKSAFGSVHAKPVALAASVRKISSPCVTSSYENIEPGADCSLKQSESSAFVTDGHVTLVGSGIEVPVKISRDTRAF